MKKQVAMLSALVMLVLVSFSVSASAEYTVVAGTIYNYEANMVISDANVTVVCDDMSIPTISDSNGDYSVQFFVSDCAVGDSVTVSAVKGDLSGMSSGVVKDYGLMVNVAVVNVPMTPEFGFYMGALTMLSAVGIFFVVRRN